MSEVPGQLVVVLGTGTEVGKTWVGARLLAELRGRGLRVAARKPTQSADPGEDGPSDADVLAGATGEHPLVVCPPHRRYGLAMAPPMAAEVLGLPPFAVADLAGEISWPTGLTIGLVETAGGALSPVASDGTNLDLARLLRPAVTVLVADAGLGTINSVRLCVASTATVLGPPIVFLNRFDPGDPLHRANLRWLVERDGSDVLVDVRALADRLVEPVSR